ncbi:MAG: hypothetical protein ABSD13_01440 [Candidatus Korobacteraceae bacterium]|jgi:hypothetical protein
MDAQQLWWDAVSRYEPVLLLELPCAAGHTSGWEVRLEKNGETSEWKVSTFEGAVQRTGCPVCGKTPGVQSVMYLDADVPVKVAGDISGTVDGKLRVPAAF